MVDEQHDTTTTVTNIHSTRNVINYNGITKLLMLIISILGFAYAATLLVSPACGAIVVGVGFLFPYAMVKNS